MKFLLWRGMGSDQRHQRKLTRETWQGKRERFMVQKFIGIWEPRIYKSLKGELQRFGFTESRIKLEKGDGLLRNGKIE